MSRPELTGQADLFYNAKEARKYDSSSRMIGIQREITERAIELLKLPTDRPSFVLDVGCGSGLSGKALEEAGHVWVGCDISRDMLTMSKERMDRKRARAAQKRKRDTFKLTNMDEAADEENKNGDDEDMYESSEEEDSDEEEYAKGHQAIASTGDLMHHDMGSGLPFRPATFDACISISALQWLCYSNATGQIPKRRLLRFFSNLYIVLRRGGRAVLQFYPETAEQAILISECAAKVGFAGGIVVDYPNSAKAKKHYLVLSFDRSYKAPQGLTGAEGALQSKGGGGGGGVTVNATHSKFVDKYGNKKAPKKKKNKFTGKTKEWIVHKKDVQRKKGKETKSDSKYTGRKRATRF